MTDIFSKKKRSEIMSKIRSKNLKQELFIRKLVYSMGYRYRLHEKNLPGKPDLAFPGLKKAIFVNGCFWHGHNHCQKSDLPLQNHAFWEKKITSNVKRDRIICKNLKNSGWDCLTIWQCDIKDTNKEKLGKKIRNFLEK